MISENQIERFFKKQCTPEEAEQVAAWLKKHPEAAVRYLPEREWQSLQQDESLSKEIQEATWHQINKKIKKQQARIWMKRSAVAACIAGCCIIGSIFLGKHKPVSTQTAYRNNINKTVVAITDTEFNSTRSTRLISLQDGSLISLSPGSVVWFDTPFAAKRVRDVYLSGEARFEVAKNKQKPFTVFAGSFSTTALGTEFIVKQFNSNINVQLMHGKVVIKATGNTVKNWKNIYLLPGQQMTYNEGYDLAKVSALQDNKIVTATKPAAKTSRQKETADNLIFNGSAMPSVLQKLSSYYNVSIRFDSSDISHISFTGTIAKKDSVQTILKVITQMNGLSLQTTDSSFVVSKNNN